MKALSTITGYGAVVEINNDRFATYDKRDHWWAVPLGYVTAFHVNSVTFSPIKPTVNPHCCYQCALESREEICWMIVCSECGNKRCPKATDHRNDCTGSNDPGQPGSHYLSRRDMIASQD